MIHIVESMIPHAGTVAVCLPDLLSALEPHGFPSTLVDSPDRLAGAMDKAQIVHIHGWGYPLSLAAANHARRAGIPYVVSPHGRLTPSSLHRPSLWHRLRAFLSDRPLIRSAASLIALNEWEERDLRNAGRNDRVIILPYGMRFSNVESAASAGNERKSLLILGPLDPESGCVAALKALAELGPTGEGWTVTLAGPDNGNWKQQLQAAVRRKGGADRVTFAEPKSANEQVALLSKSDVLLAPGMRVTPAISIMQAFDAAVPVVATHSAAPPGMNGELVVCGSSRHEIREGLRSVLNLSVAQTRERVQLARKRAAGLYDWSVLAPRYAELYRSCIKN